MPFYDRSGLIHETLDTLHDALYAEGFTIYPGKTAGQPTFRLSVLGAIDVSDIERFLTALNRFLARVRCAHPR